MNLSPNWINPFLLGFLIFIPTSFLKRFIAKSQNYLLYINMCFKINVDVNNIAKYIIHKHVPSSWHHFCCLKHFLLRAQPVWQSNYCYKIVGSNNYMFFFFTKVIDIVDMTHKDIHIPYFLYNISFSISVIRPI